MCMTKRELENKVQELRSLKAMKEELENELKAVEHSIIDYMTEGGYYGDYINKWKILHSD